MTATVEEVAAELYAGPLAEFVAVRNARAKETTDQEVASRIRALRKPTLAAWVVNVFATERAAQLGEALRLAGDLREAQAGLDAAALAQLGRERRALTRRLAVDAAALAQARGEKVTAATIEAVERTLTAAFFDPDAAAAVASGRLVHDLEPSAPVDLAEVVGGGAPGAPRIAPAPADEVKARRERRKAESALYDAEQALARAKREHAAAAGEARGADRRAAELAARLTELEEELTALRAAADTAQAAVAAARAHETDAAARLAESEAAADAARRAVDEFRP